MLLLLAAERLLTPLPTTPPDLPTPLTLMRPTTPIKILLRIILLITVNTQPLLQIHIPPIIQPIDLISELSLMIPQHLDFELLLAQQLTGCFVLGKLLFVFLF